jgi:hypothetical protein
MPMSYTSRTGAGPAGTTPQPQPRMDANVMPGGPVPLPMVGYHGPVGDGSGHEMMVFMHGPQGSSEGFTKFLRDLMARGKARDKMQYHPNILGMMEKMNRTGGGGY